LDRVQRIHHPASLNAPLERNLVSLFANAEPLDVPAGILRNTGSSNRALVCAIPTALAGSLELRGVNNHDGSPAAWSFEPGACGAFVPPGTADGFFHALSWSFSNPEDAGRVLIAWLPL
jgi:hypothetical protein